MCCPVYSLSVLVVVVRVTLYGFERFLCFGIEQIHDLLVVDLEQRHLDVVLEVGKTLSTYTRMQRDAHIMA